jgi:hypothetical protein
VEVEAIASRAHELSCIITPDKMRGTYWDRIKCKEHFGKLMGAVKRQATINPDSQIWKTLEDSMLKMYCVDLAEAYVMLGEHKLEACVKKMLRAEAKAKAVRKISPK